jgi:hypothetical protein
MVEFFATEIGYYEDLGVVSCGASNAKSTEEYHYINFQRSLDVGGSDDEGVYFEIDDQSQGGYNNIADCELHPDKLIVKLAAPFGCMESNSIVVRFGAPASEGLSSIEQGLKKVFVGYENLLKIQP